MIKQASEYHYNAEEVFKTYYAPLCYFATRFIGKKEEAEDLVQDLFIFLIEKKQTFLSEIHLKNFLYISVKNACLNHIRQGNSREKYSTAQKKEGNESEDLFQHIVSTEVYKELAEAIAALPPECRKVFEACYFEGLDNEQAAQKLGISIFTVKAQKARGKKILKENLKDLFPLFLFLFENF